MTRLIKFHPYLFNAYYSWFIDSGVTPHLLVNATVPGVQVPMDYVLADKTIVLSIGAGAVKDFISDENGISFKTTFGGHLEDIVVPYQAMEQLIAKEEHIGIPLAAAMNALDISLGECREEDEAEDDNSVMEFVSDDDNGSTEGKEREDTNSTDAGFEFVLDDDEKK